MTKVIRFSKFRIIFPVISVSLIIVGLVVTFSSGGLNLGIDFQSGLNIRLQIAPVAARVSYTGEGSASLDIRGGRFIVSETSDNGTERTSLDLTTYDSVAALERALADIPGLRIEAVDAGVSPEAFLPFEREMELGSIPKSINVLPGPDFQTDIATVRDALAPLGAPQIQTIGTPDQNDFMIRIEEEEGSQDFDTTIAESVTELLTDEFGDGTVLIRQTDYVGAQFSSNLAQQTVYLSVLALLLILAYTWFRFRLGYAVSAITALVHDSLFIFAFIGVTGLEFSTATIAAVLTIIGYSLNDTIVIFDRIRENTGILRNEEFRRIVDTSVTQSLSRTLMTSVTTLLAVGAIYIFATGTIQDFALSMIVGVLVGTYSSIFVASPILIGWTNNVSRRRKAKDAERYGTRETATKPAAAGAGASATQEVEAPSADTSGGERPIPKYERKLKGKRKKKK